MCQMKLNKILSYIEEFKQSTRLFIQHFGDEDFGRISRVGNTI